MGAVPIGIDLGPDLSVTGSLATTPSLAALRREGLDIGALPFLSLGMVVTPPALLLALAAPALQAGLPEPAGTARRSSRHHLTIGIHGERSMSDGIDQSDGIGGKHASARQFAERALRAQAAGDDEEADRLFAEANRIDPEAVIAALQDRIDDPVSGNPGGQAPDDPGPQDDDEIAAMSRTVEPGSDAPSRSGITGPGSGADAQDR